MLTSPKAFMLTSSIVDIFLVDISESSWWQLVLSQEHNRMTRVGLESRP